MKLSVIIPIYNERASVDRVIAAVREAPRPTGCAELEIVLVDDGSTDGSTALVESYRGQPDVVVILSPGNRGKGAAVRAGIAKASGDLVLIQDADLEYDTHDYPKLIEPFLRDGARVVYGSRFLGRGRVEGMRAPYYLANLILRGLTNVLYGSHITDEATAYKMVRADVLRGLDLEAERFEICPEMTAKLLRQGEQIVEVPISYRGRSKEEGKKIRLRDAFEAAWTLVRWRVGPLRRRSR